MSVHADQVVLYTSIGLLDADTDSAECIMPRLRVRVPVMRDSSSQALVHRLSSFARLCLSASPPVAAALFFQLPVTATARHPFPRRQVASPLELRHGHFYIQLHSLFIEHFYNA